MFAAIPLLSFPVAAYVFFVFVWDAGGAGAATQAVHSRLTDPLFTLGGAAGNGWPISVADLLVAAALVVMFVELLKAPPGRAVAAANHALTILLFIMCLAALLLVPQFSTSTFLLITLMILLDVVAGFILTFAPPGEEGL